MPGAARCNLSVSKRRIGRLPNPCGGALSGRLRGISRLIQLWGIRPNLLIPLICLALFLVIVTSDPPKYRFATGDIDGKSDNSERKEYQSVRVARRYPRGVNGNHCVSPLVTGRCRPPKRRAASLTVLRRGPVAGMKDIKWAGFVHHLRSFVGI
jgi:hypothetical protein